MAAETEHAGEQLAGQHDASTYIQHHLTFFAKPVGDSAGGFWTIHYDTLITSLILGVLVLGFIWLVTRKATAGVPSKTQAFVELTVGFVNDQVRSMFHHDYRIVAPIALTVGLWVLFMNAMDFLPVDIMAWIYEHVFDQHTWRSVPTADVNTTFALSLSVFGLMIFYSIKNKGLGGWLHELLRHAVRPQAALAVAAADAVQSAVQPDRIHFQAVVALAAAVRQHVRRRNHVPADRAAGAGAASWLHRATLTFGSVRRPQRRLVDLPHPDRRSAGVHFHDADRRVHRDGARASLASVLR